MMWNAMLSLNKSFAIFIYFQKAFETIDQTIFLKLILKKEF